MIAKVQDNCVTSNMEIKTVADLKKEFLNIRFWDIREASGVIDKNKSQHENVELFSMMWNHTNPAKGKMTDGRSAVLKQIIYAMFTQMEACRTQNPLKYLTYLTTDYIPVRLTRMDIVNLMGKTICAKTAYNRLCALMDMYIDTKQGKEYFIVGKHATSRTLINGEAFRKKGGRGKFEVLINRKMLAFNIDYACFLKHSESITYESKRKNLPLYKPNTSSISKEYSNNNRIGVPSEQTIICTDFQSENEQRNEDGDTSSANFQIAAPKNLPAADISPDFEGSPLDFFGLIPENPIVQPAAAPESKREAYFQKLEQIDKINAKIPKDSTGLAVWVLAALLKRLIYPNLNATYWESIYSEVCELLKLHITRLEPMGWTGNLWKGMGFVSRGIYLVHRHLKKHADKYPNGMKYKPLQFLRLDDITMKDGRIIAPYFRNVMDKWVNAERKRMHELAADNSQFMGWQAAHEREQTLFLRIVQQMKKPNAGYSEAMGMAGTAKQTLENLAKEYNLKDSTLRNVMKSFATKINAVKAEAEKAGEINNLQNWEVFSKEFFRNAA